MPLYSSSPFIPIVQAKPGTPVYMLGGFTDTVAPTRFLVRQVTGDTSHATLAGIILEGDIPKPGDLITIMGSSHAPLNVIATPITAVNISHVSGTGTIKFQSTWEPPPTPKTVKFPITHVAVYLHLILPHWDITMQAVNDLQVGEEITFEGLTHLTDLNGHTRTIVNQLNDSITDTQHAERTPTTISLDHALFPPEVEGSHSETGFAKTTREVIVPVHDAALGIITRQPQFETVHENDKSIAVCLPDSPEGHSVQGFSVDLYSQQPSHVAIVVEGANDNRDSAYQELGVIDGTTYKPHQRWDSGVILSANFVRLKVQEIQGGSHAALAARLLVR